jgi:hypothetical protein
MKSTCPAPERLAATPATPVTHPFDRLLDAPLADVLAENRVQLVDSSITDAGFYGAYIEGRDGSRVLSMPVGRSAIERDLMSRRLLADALGL